MTGLIMAAQLILGLAILVTLHELGHFLAARAFGIRVEKFYLFFDAWGIKLFSFTKGDTEYGVGWLPLGGYVKISGMIDESMDKEQMALPPKPYEFRSKPAWQRLIVMVAGVTMNVILGIAIFSYSLLHYKKEYLPNDELKNGIHAYKLGQELGLQTGDKITAINGKKFERFDDLLSTRILFGATLTVDRNGTFIEITVPDNFYRTVQKEGLYRFIGTGEFSLNVEQVVQGSNAEKAGLKKEDKILAINNVPYNPEQNLREVFGKNLNEIIPLSVDRDNRIIMVQVLISADSTIGIVPSTGYYSRSHKLKDYTVFSATYYGVSDAVEALVSNAKGLKKIFTGEEKATESIQGPIGIATIYGGRWDWERFWVITGLLSMVLAFMNILPIPALDGGHVIFLTIEAITRRKFSDKFMERSQVVGMVILLALMAFAIGNDVWKHVLN
jgi:regulator of sigma E protease